RWTKPGDIWWESNPFACNRAIPSPANWPAYGSMACLRKRLEFTVERSPAPLQSRWTPLPESTSRPRVLPWLPSAKRRSYGTRWRRSACPLRWFAELICRMGAAQLQRQKLHPDETGGTDRTDHQQRENPPVCTIRLIFFRGSCPLEGSRVLSFILRQCRGEV